MVNVTIILSIAPLTVLKPVTLYCQCSFVCWVYHIMMIRLYISCIKHTINRAHNTLVAYYNSITTIGPVSGDIMLMESGMLLAFINQTNITTLMRWELLWENQIRWNLDCLIWQLQMEASLSKLNSYSIFIHRLS